MAYRSLSVTLTADTAPYMASLKEAGTETRAFGATATAAGKEAQVGFDASAKGAAAAAAAAEALAAAEARAAVAAEANVAKKVASNAALQQQAAAYKAISDAAVAGSDKQVAADRLLEVANKKLAASNLEVVESSSLMAGAAEKLGNIFEQIGLRVERSHGLVGAAIKGMASDASAMATGVGTAVGVVGAAFGVLALEGVKHFEELTGQIRAFQRVAGTSAEDSSKLVFALHELGIEPEQASKALGILANNLFNHADKVAADGVQIAHLKNGNVDLIGSFLNLADTYKTLGAAEGDVVAKNELGKSYQALLPLLGKTREQLQGIFDDASKHGVVFNQSDIEKGRDLTIATRELHTAFNSFEIDLAKNVVPAITDLVHGFTSITDATRELHLPVVPLLEVGAAALIASKGVAALGAGMAMVGLESAGATVAGLAAATGGTVLLAGAAYEVSKALADHFNPALDASQINAKKLADIGSVFGSHVADDISAAVALSNAANGEAKAFDDAKVSLASFGDSVDDTETSMSTLTETHKQEIAEAQRHEKALTSSADSIGLSLQGLTADIGYSSRVNSEAFAAEEEAAKRFATAVSQGSAAAAASLAKDTDAVSAFSASSLASADKAAAASTKAANTMANDDTRVADAIQHVADLQEQYADKAASDRQAYADKVAQADQAMTDADQNYADTVESSNQRVRDADQKLADDRISMAQTVADAEARLLDDRAAGQQSVHDAQQRLNDLQRRQAVANNPAASKALNDQIALRDARAAVTKAQEAAAKKEEADLDAITKAKQNQIKTLAKDQEAADKARTEAARAVEKAEDGVTKAREAQNKLAAEASKIGVETVQQQREMQRAVEAVTKAQQTEAQAAMTATGSVAKAVGTSVEDIKGFYDKSFADGAKFSEGIRTAIEKGYDPGFIAKLMEEGPKQAAPVIDLILSQNDDTLRGIINSGEESLRKQALALADMNHNVEVASKTSSGQVRDDFELSMKALPLLAANGGHMTASALADALGIGVKDVERIASEYGGALAAGINPVLAGVGAPTIDARPNMRGTNPATGDPFGAATGGPVPGYGTGDIVPAMLTPGEFVIRKPAVDAIGLDNLHALNAQGFATGGFVSAGDVPMPPDLSRYGTAVGYAGTKADRYEYDKVIAYLAGRHAATGGSASGNGYGYQALIDYLNTTGTPNTVTSTTGGGHVEGSLHYRGLAADFVSDNMQAIFDQFLRVMPSMQELFYDPAGYSLKNGQRVDWTVGGHSDHVHAGSWANASEGPGLPTGGPGDKGGTYQGGGQLDDWITEALHLGGKPESWHKGIYDRAMQESGGDPNAVNNWDSNAAAGHPTQGVMQMRDDTFARWALPGHTDIRNPVDNIASADNYIEDRYGDPYHLPAGGYERGGLVRYASYDNGGWLQPGLTLAYNGTGAREPVGAGAAIDYNRLAAALRDSIPVALYIDGQEFARSTAPAMSREFLNMKRARS